MENRTNLISVEVLLFLVLGLATIIFHQYCWPIKTKRTHPLPPGPRGLPIVGCLPQMLRNKPAFRWIHKLMQDMDTEIACIRLGGTHVIPVTSPELSREFLKKQDAVFASRPDCMSCNLTSNEYLMGGLSPLGDQWKKMRRILVAEVLSPQMHRWLYSKRCEEADHTVRYVYKQCTDPLKNGLVNVRFVGRHYSGNLLRKMVFGKRFFGRGMEDGAPGVEEIEHVAGVFTTIDHVYGFPIADFIPFLGVFDLDGRRQSHLEAIKKVRKYQDPEIINRVEMWRHGIRTTEEDILDVLINLKDSKNNPLLSIQEIEVQIIEMMLATIDNPPNTAEWCIAEMINQPDIFENACKELDRVVGRDRLVNESDLSKLNYIKACIKEAFRLHPVAPFNLPHVSTKDTIVGDYFIPKGSHVVLSRTGLGRNPRVWEDPLKYKPERHVINEDAEVVLSDPELRMLSFSTGRRGCPGIVLGSASTTILLARLIQAFDWSAPPDRPRVDLVEMERGLLMANPLILRANPRLKEDVYKQLLA